MASVYAYLIKLRMSLKLRVMRCRNFRGMERESDVKGRRECGWILAATETETVMGLVHGNGREWKFKNRPPLLYSVVLSSSVQYWSTDVYHLGHSRNYWTELNTIASCLINAQPLPTHRPAADDNLIGCTRPRLDRWLVAAQCPFRW